MALDIDDFNNAEEDLKLVQKLVTSSELEATDRLGVTKKTWAGIEQDLGAAYAMTVTGANRLATEEARQEAGLFAGQSQLAASVDYSVGTIADRDALTPTAGQKVFVRATALFYDWNGSAWGAGYEGFLGTKADKTEVAPVVAAAGLDPLEIPQAWETRDMDEAPVLVFDAAGNIIRRVTNQATSPEVVAEPFESRDTRVPFLDRNGNVLFYLGGGDGDSGAVDAVAAALSVHIVEQSAVNAAVEKSLRAASPYLCLSELRSVRMKLEKIKHGENVQAIFAGEGDSFSAPNGSYLHIVAKRLQAEYGFAGLGYTGFAWSANAAPTTWSGGSQPTGKELCARYDLSPSGEIVQHFGSWGCRRGAFTSPIVLGPTRARVYSTEVDAYIRFYVCPAPGGYANSARLFHAPVDTTAGTMAVSWDDGATYGSNIAIPNTTGSFALTGAPALGGWARIKVVSGEVSLCGVNLVNTAPGVIMHKLAIYGASATNFGSGTTAPNRATWSQQIKALGPDLISNMLGTNDQAGNISSSSFVAEMRLIFDTLRAEMPAIDTYWLMPPENNRTNNPVLMTAYAEAARAAAMLGRHALVDTQWDVGDPANYGAAYAYANPNRSWWMSDLTHPNATEGQYALASAYLRGIFN